ncbi:MAG: hypothetical protein HOV81_12100 [Kofleriaceae bacterium]|nr:hypothetical protein [Kofleriaceae bacterium]
MLTLVACSEAPVQQDTPDAGVTVDSGSGSGDPDAAVPEDPGSFEVNLQRSQHPLVTGTTTSLMVNVTRHGAFAGAVTLEAAGLPAGVVAPPVTVAAGETTGTLELMTATTAAHSLPTTVTIKGTADTLTSIATATMTVRGLPGSIDQTFAGGKKLVPMGSASDTAYATAVQPDGKIIVAGFASAVHSGDFAVTRLDRDGNVDTTFGVNGKVFTDFGSLDSAYAVAVQPDGKIVVAGMATMPGSSFDFAVARYNSDGSPDTTFSGDGKATVAVGGGLDVAYAVIVQANGRIVLGGETNRATIPYDTDFALVGFLPDGSLDTTFGAQGIAITPVRAGTGRDVIFALAVARDASNPGDPVGNEKFYAVGGDNDFAVARYSANGQLDTTFGMQGLVTGVFQSTVGAARAIAVTPTGELFVAGHINHDFAAVKLSPSGAVAMPFGRSIAAVTSTNSDEAYGIVLDGNKPILAGWVYEGASQSPNFALVRLNTDGTLDNSFGTGGRVVTEMAQAGQPDQANAIALQTDSQIPAVRAIVVGSADNDFAIARYWQ